jgi:Tfp pilus assembly protein PilV
MSKKQKGFSVIEGLLILVIVGILGGVGYYVWNSSKASPEDSSTLNTNNTATSPSNTSNPAPVEKKYLTIKEWGVKFTLSSGILDASYTIGEFDYNTDFLRTEALKGTECTGGYIIKFKSSDFNSESKQDYIKEFPDAIKIKDNYYAYGLNPANVECSDDKAIQAKANKAAAEFKKAINTVQAVD